MAKMTKLPRFARTQDVNLVREGGSNSGSDAHVKDGLGTAVAHEEDHVHGDTAVI